MKRRWCTRSSRMQVHTDPGVVPLHFLASFIPVPVRVTVNYTYLLYLRHARHGQPHWKVNIYLPQQEVD
jgi:hypothetical protein